jgi:proteic killer suppression protein
MAIQAFARRQVERFFFEGVVPKGEGWSSVARVAARKLDVLDYAARLSDMRAPPGNRLEALKGEFAGYHSIRINDQWRVVFRWEDGGPTAVDIVDYHKG